MKLTNLSTTISSDRTSQGPDLINSFTPYSSAIASVEIHHCQLVPAQPKQSQLINPTVPHKKQPPAAQIWDNFDIWDVGNTRDMGVSSYEGRILGGYLLSASLFKKSLNLHSS